MNHFSPFICDNFTKKQNILQDMFCVVKHTSIFFSCLSLFFCVIKLKKFFWVLTELNKTFAWKLGQKKYLKEPLIHTYANLHSIHTNKQEDVNIETHSAGSKLTETKSTSGFCEKKAAHEGFLQYRGLMPTGLSSKHLSCLFEQQ